MVLYAKIRRCFDRTDEIRKMEGGGKKEESQPLTSKNEVYKSALSDVSRKM